MGRLKQKSLCVWVTQTNGLLAAAEMQQVQCPADGVSLAKCSKLWTGDSEALVADVRGTVHVPRQPTVAYDDWSWTVWRLVDNHRSAIAP